MASIKDKNLLGAAGEHLVLFGLLSKEMLAAKAPTIKRESLSIFSK
jgi:hypothetical protein